MTDYLRAAYERYREDNVLIHPISKVDAEIIDQLLLIFERQKNVAVVDILNNYKLEKDTDTLSLLRDYNKQTKSKDGSVSTIMNEVFGESIADLNIKRYLKASGSTIDLFDIYGYDIYQWYHEETARFCIKLNPTPEEAKKVPFYANTVLTFFSKKERQEAIDKIDEFFIKNRGQMANGDSVTTSKNPADEESHDDYDEEVDE